MRAACGLPAGTQRLIFGKPPVLDGQELASDIQVLLRLAELAGRGSLTTAATCRRSRAERRVAGRP